MNGNAPRFKSYLESLHSHRKVVLLPDSFIHLSILSSTKLVLHRDVSSLYLPLVVVWRDAVNSGLIAFGRRVVQSGDEPICNGWMMMDQLCQGVEAALWRDIQLGTKERETTQSHNAHQSIQMQKLHYKIVKPKCCITSTRPAVLWAPPALLPVLRTQSCQQSTRTWKCMDPGANTCTSL